MYLLNFAVDIYFALTLMIAAFVKIDNPITFSITLTRQGIFPIWIIKVFSPFLPWLELFLSIMIIISTGILALIISILIAMLFAGFLMIKIALFLKKTGIGCGCFNSKQFIDIYDIIISLFLVILALVHCWLAISISTDSVLQLISITIVGGLSVRIGTKILMKRIKFKYNRKIDIILY